MEIRKLRSDGPSLVITIPFRIRKLLKLNPNDFMNLTVTLDQNILLEKYDPLEKSGHR